MLKLDLSENKRKRQGAQDLTATPYTLTAILKSMLCGLPYLHVELLLFQVKFLDHVDPRCCRALWKGSALESISRCQGLLLYLNDPWMV